VNAGAEAIACGLGCFFALFSLMAIQGGILNLLPGRWFGRVSTAVQGTLIGALLLAGFYSFSMQERNQKAIAELPRIGAWAPMVWFAGLHEVVLGDRDAFLVAMATRAVAAVVLAAGLAVAVYYISYRRYRRLLMENPVALSSRRRRRRRLASVLARTPRQEAVMDFMAATLARSRPHRTIWLGYLGGTAAILLNSSLLSGRAMGHGTGVRRAFEFIVLFWPLAATMTVLNGFRHVLSVPSELRANWLFQITESQGRGEWMQAVERFILFRTLVPMYVVSAPVAVLTVGWTLAVRMTGLQMLVSLTVFEMMFYGWQRLPFTCSYVPGKRPLVAVLSGYLVLLCALVPMLAIYISVAARVPGLFVVFLVAFGGAWISMRGRRREGWGEAKIEYEDLFETMPNLGIREMTYGGTEIRGVVAGDAGHADFENADAGADARVCGGGIYSTDLGGSAEGGGGGALSGAAPAGTAGPVGGGVGSIGEQQAGKVLPAFGAGAAAPDGGSGAMEAGHAGDRPHYGARLAEGEFGERAATLYLKLRALWKRRDLERELDEELQFHLAMREEANLRDRGQGGAAEVAARRRFGNVTGIKERCRDLWTFRWFETFLQDVRYAVRQLRRSPGFAFSAAITLALGIGATTAVYSLLAAMLWRPVRLPDVDSLVFIFQAQTGNAFTYAPAGDLGDIRGESTAIDNLAIWALGRHSVVDAGGEPLVTESARVSPNFFDMLGVRPALGRGFLPGEDQPGRERVVVLGQDLWRQHFGADRGIVGKTIRVDSSNFTVVGVMPPEFRFPRAFRELWVPLVLTPEARMSHKDTGVEAAGRLRRGHTRAQAAAELNVIASRLEKRYPETNRNRRYLAMNLARYSFGDVAPIFSALMLGASLFVLLIACVNVANLLFARAAGRYREVALRVALGAGRTRLIRQLLTESLVLAGGGAALGLLVAKWTLGMLRAAFPAELRHYVPGWAEIGLNAEALRFTLAVALASGIVAGLAPALRSLRVDLTESLKEGGHGSSGGRGRSRWRGVLVTAEIAMATMLLVSSVLMVRGFRALANGGAKLRPAAVLTMRLAIGGERFRESRQVAGFYRELLERAAAIPGVQSAVAATGLPYSRRYPSGTFSIEGRDKRPPGEEPSAIVESVTPNYFKTMFVPLRSGRFLSDGDGPRAVPVAVISASAAQRWWKGEEPIGKTIMLRGRGPISIVGVVGDLPYTALSREASPTIYVPFEQAPDREMDIGLRTTGDPAMVASEIRAVVKAMDPELPVTNLNTMATLIRQESIGMAMMAELMGGSGLLALVLSVVGVYGVMAYSISGRTHETGIRMALGARRGQVLFLLFRGGVRSALVGLIIGLMPAWGVARVMQAIVFGVKAADAAAFVGVPLVLMAASAIAIYVPAARATRIDPIRALHHE
jgi:putative ABC transport system permease protein